MIQRDDARIFALNVLGWMAGEEDVFGAFLGATGASVDEVRANAGDESMLISVLDFVLQSDDWVISAAQATGLRPEDVAQVRLTLGGRDRMHWT